MKRNERARMAQETVAICDAGFYVTPGGRRVELAALIKDAVAGTVLHLPDASAAASPARFETRVTVTNETTFAALARLAATTEGHVACLNFASAKNPGGGFLGGAQAQEECLARASALYRCLLAQPSHYERNRANRSALYLDLAIFSPRVPFFRDDEGRLLDAPVLASVITAAAPNAGAVLANEPQNHDLIEPVLKRRAGLVLDIAAKHGVTHLVLGAWGCGVFRNDPAMVARAFADWLHGPFARRFQEVVFAVYDASPAQENYGAFKDILGSPDVEVEFPNPLLNLFTACESHCVAGCCGVDAFDTSIECIRIWAHKAGIRDVQIALAQIEEQRRKSANARGDIVSDRINAVWTYQQFCDWLERWEKPLQIVLSEQS
ncbi:MAG: TIGR02452 family protein [Verrucomicrobiota bacterium]